MPKSKAIDKLSPSHLDSPHQMEMLGGDLDIDSLILQMRRGTGLDISEAITDAILDRTIEGASTLTVNLDDDEDRTIQTSGHLGHGVDVNIDGLWWTLVGVQKNGRALNLTFEEREVNLLRRYNSVIFADRNKTTRAQFVLRMIREVQETHLDWHIPELHIKQDISDIAQNQILVGPDGKPLNSSVSTADATTAAAERGKGINTKADLKVRGVQATREQIKNADIVLSTGEGMKANRKVLISSIMTAIDESNIRNLTGGDRDSVGVFQQRPSSGWPASRNVAVDAAAYFKQAIRADADTPNLSIQMLCQVVQRSGTSDGSNYAKFIDEATAFVDAFDRNPTSAEQQSLATTTTIANNTQWFIRGQITKAKGLTGAYVLTPENSWNCMQRLAQEVNWRAFVVSGAIYFISDHWLFKSKPFDVISEDSPGIDWIDYDYTEGKHKATLTIIAHLKRWSCPPGSTIGIKHMGIINGKYLINEVSRSMFDTIATITAEKPLPILPEPIALSGVPQNFESGRNPKTGNKGVSIDVTQGNRIQKLVVAYAESQLGVPYVWGGETPGKGFDCSGLTQAAYDSAGLGIPRTSQTQWAVGRKLSKAEVLQPGDLVFFAGSDGTMSQPGHVGIYIGHGNMIDAPHTGARVRVDKSFMKWPDYVGATRPWQSPSVIHKH